MVKGNATRFNKKSRDQKICTEIAANHSVLENTVGNSTYGEQGASNALVIKKQKV